MDVELFTEQTICMNVHPYQKLVAWQLAHMLCIHAYTVTKKFPAFEKYRLVDQICRSAYSAPMNLAEGNARRSPKEKARFFEMALASLEEPHYQFLLSKDLGYITNVEFEELEHKVGRVSYLVTRLRAAQQSLP